MYNVNSDIKEAVTVIDNNIKQSMDVFPGSRGFTEEESENHNRMVSGLLQGVTATTKLWGR